MDKMSNKLLADYDSDHVVMVYPSMYDKCIYFEDFKKIYLDLSTILSENSINHNTKNS